MEASLEKKIDEVQSREVIQRFQDCCFKNDAFILIYSDKVSRIRLIVGAPIQVIDSKYLTRTVKLLAQLPSVSVKPKAVHEMIAIQNPTMKMGGWKEIDVNAHSQATQLIIIAETGVYEKIDCRRNYGLKRIDMKILSKTKFIPEDRALDLFLEKVKETTRI